MTSSSSTTITTNPVEAHQFDTLNPCYNAGRVWASSQARPDQLAGVRRLIADSAKPIDFDRLVREFVRIVNDHDEHESIREGDINAWIEDNIDLEPGEEFEEEQLAAFLRGIFAVKPAIDDDLRDKVEAEVREEVEEDFRDRLNAFTVGRGADDAMFAGLDPDKAGDLAQAERRVEPIMEAQIESMVERRLEAAAARLTDGVTSLG